MALFLSDEVVASQLSIVDAVRCVDEAFQALARGEARNGVRTRTMVGPAVLNLMWAFAPTIRMMGVKSYLTAGHGVTRGTTLNLLLYLMQTGELVGHLQANLLGQIRTGAATVVATRAMANREPSVLAIYGTGFQAEYQVRCLLTVLETIRDVHVVGRDPDRTSVFVRRLSVEFGNVRFLPCNSFTAASGADVIVTATASATPLFEASWLKPGVHINAIGSNDPGKCEIGRDVLERADLILVDDHEVAAAECGDLVANHWDLSEIGTLGDLLIGKVPGRWSPGEITVFESQGLAILDVVAGAFALTQAGQKGLGVNLGA